MNDFEGKILVGIPEKTANMSLPDPDLRDYYRYEQDRVFWLNEGIEDCAEDLIRMILRCNQEDKGLTTEERKPIKIMIDSNGGDVTFMWTIINLIETSKTPVYTINYCTAFSAAAEILASGHKRFSLKGCHVLLHSGSCFYGGQADAVDSQKKYFDKLSKKINAHLLAKTKIDPKVYKRKAVTDWFFDEEEALELGVIDKIIEDLDEIL